MSATRCGISAKQIERETGVTYKTAWRMFKQIRTMLDDEKAAPLGGKSGPGVEMDEMYFGGRRKGTVGRPLAGDYKDKKTTVVGMVERKGRVRAVVAADVKGSTLLGLVTRANDGDISRGLRDLCKQASDKNFIADAKIISFNCGLICKHRKGNMINVQLRQLKWRE
jgi:hypothetical protein